MSLSDVSICFLVYIKKRKGSEKLNKAYVIAMCIVAFNLVLIWFNAMEFFSYQPMGTDVSYNLESYGIGNLLVDGLLASGLSIVGFFTARYLRVNALAMVLFVNIFWFPYTKTMGIFHEMFKDAPEAFLGIIAIFTTLMLFVFAYALIEMSSTAVISG